MGDKSYTYLLKGFLIVVTFTFFLSATSVGAQTLKEELYTLLELSSDPAKAKKAGDEKLGAFIKELDKNDPVWPVKIFLIAEAFLLNNQETKAKKLYRELTEWAMSDPYGGCGLAAIALWRWVTLLSPSSNAFDEEFTSVIRATQDLFKKLMIKRMFKYSILPALPKVQEEIFENLAIISWKNGDPELAQDLILNYFRIAAVDKPDASIDPIVKSLFESGKAIKEKISLFLAKNLIGQAQFPEANRLLRLVIDEGEPNDVHQAYMLLTDLQKNRGDDDTDLLLSLTELIDDKPQPALELKARFKRAMIYKGQGNRKLFLQDLQYIIDNLAGGDLTDDSLLEIAREYQMSNEIEMAIDYFNRTLNFDGKIDVAMTASIQLAFTKYAKWRQSNNSTELNDAKLLFEKVRQRSRPGRLYALTTFWLARLLEESDVVEKAAEYFNELIENYRFDYYGIRAQMHLTNLESVSNHNRNIACSRVLPEEKTLQHLSSGISNTKRKFESNYKTPYHGRLEKSLDLYRKVLSAKDELRKRNPGSRMQEISPKILADGGLLPRIALLLSFRIDALLAATAKGKEEKSVDPKNLLRISSLVGQGAGDWSVSIGLSMIKNPEIMREPDYVYIAYPKIYTEDFAIKKSRNLQIFSGLLYGVVRQETHFVDSALSNRGALGLFQFTRKMFLLLNEEYNLLSNSPFDSWEAYLLDPQYNLKLGKLLFSEKLLKKYDNNAFYAILAHNIGEKTVNLWIASWKAMDANNDIEFMIETARATSTRNFVRNVLTDWILINLVTSSTGG